jgi:hypothetical protein
VTQHMDSSRMNAERKKMPRGGVWLRVCIWLLVGGGLYGLRYEFGMFGDLLCSLFLIVATAVTLAMLARATTRRGAALLAVGLLGLFLYGAQTARLVRFWVLKPGYQAVIREVEQGLRDEDPIRARRTAFRIDDGMPLRVAFPWDGIIDNWYGVVYDPTDELSRFCGDAGRNSGGFLKDPTLRQLFGGTMTYCERLSQGWYFCWFT